MLLDNVIEKITDEVEKRVIANLENLMFNIELTVVPRDGVTDREEALSSSDSDTDREETLSSSTTIGS